MPPQFVPAIEILGLAIAMYYILVFFWNTRALDLVLAVIGFLALYLGVSWLNLPVLQQLMQSFANVAAIALVVIFQPELRIALSKLTARGRKKEKLTEFEGFLEHLTASVYRMAEKRIGALIVLERDDSLHEYAAKAVPLNAQFSSELLESIFIGSSPLHDGAVIIRGTTIVAAGCILPLVDESSQISRSMGTRHRAGLGITQVRDAISIVVSEESGRVSIARDGIMTRGVKADRFKGIIHSIFNPQPNAPHHEET